MMINLDSLIDVARAVGEPNRLRMLCLCQDQRVAVSEFATVLGLGEPNVSRHLKLLEEAGMTVNKNAVPNDPRPPMVTSGLRIGSPAITTRGFREAEATQVANWIADVVQANGADEVVARVRGEVLALCARFPVYARG